MKKILIASIIAASTLSAQWFVGADYVVSSSMTKNIDNGYTSNDVDFEYKPLVFKIGAGTPGDWNMNIYYSSEKVEYDVGKSNKPLVEFGYDIRKEFGMSSVKGLAPFIQGGISYGWMDDYAYGETAANTGLKLGIGVSYLMAKHVQFIVGYDYKIRVWQDITYETMNSSTTISTLDSGTRVYVGCNFWFGSTDSSYEQSHNNMNNNTLSSPASINTPASSSSADIE